MSAGRLTAVGALNTSTVALAFKPVSVVAVMVVVPIETPLTSPDEDTVAIFSFSEIHVKLT